MTTALPAQRREADKFILLALVLVTTAVAGGMAMSGISTWLEAASFITGAVCVWLTVKENIWNFPIGMLNAATYCIVFFHAKLFADAGLQIVYFIMAGIGWYLWLHGGTNHTALRVARAGWRERLLIAVGIVVLTLVLWRLLRQFGGSASFWDALTTAISLGAQWLLNRKRLENWVAWIIVDAIYVPLYIHKELYLTAVLYAVFLVMAIIGLRQWLAAWYAQRMVEAIPR